MTAPADRPAAGRILDVQDYADEVARLRAALVEIADRDAATLEGAMLGMIARDALADPFPCTPIRDLLAAAGFVLIGPGDKTLVRDYNLDTWEIWANPRATLPIHLVFPREGGRYWSEREFWVYERKARDFLRHYSAPQETP